MENIESGPTGSDQQADPSEQQFMNSLGTQLHSLHDIVF